MLLWFGVALLVLYPATAVCLTLLSRRDPQRTFSVGGWAVRKRDLTAAQWRRRYLPRGLAAGSALVALGLVIDAARPRR